MTSSGNLTPVSFRKVRGHAPRLSKPYVPGAPKHERFWSETELQVLRDHYERHGPDHCIGLLRGRGKTAVYQTAANLGLKAPNRKAERQTHASTPELDARIREAWPELKGRGAVYALADRLRVPRWWLSKQATRLGLTMPHKKEPNWGPAEIELLRKTPLSNLDAAVDVFRAHGFARSPASLMNKAKRLSVSRRYSASFSATRVAKILGVDGKTVTREILAGDLKAEKRATRRLPQQGGDPWSVERADLRRYVIDNLERIDFRKVDKFELVELLTRDSDSPPPHPRRPRPWPSRKLNRRAPASPRTAQGLVRIMRPPTSSCSRDRATAICATTTSAPSSSSTSTSTCRRRRAASTPSIAAF